jgi:hypothetical protein
VAIGYEAELAHEPVWMLWNVEKYLVPAGNGTPAVQSVASVDFAIPAHKIKK